MRSTRLPVSKGKRSPLRPLATPLNPVARPTALSGKRSVIAPYMFAERKLCPKIAMLIINSEMDIAEQNGTIKLARQNKLLTSIVIRRTL